MIPAPFAAIVLAAGQGTRMKSRLPKVMHRLANRPMILHVLAALEPLGPQRVVVVVAPGMEEVAKAVAPQALTAIQSPALGTGHAVASAREALKGFTGDVVVLNGDGPLITSETVAALLKERKASGAAAVVGGMRPASPGAYGRLVLDKSGNLEAIVEAGEATPEQAAIGLCNSGLWAIDGARLFDLVDAIGKDNAKGEYYLTDIVAIARKRGFSCRVVEGSAEEFAGVNSRAELADAEAALQQRYRSAAMAEGVTLTAPETVYFSADTRIGRDTVIGPNVVFGPGVTLGEGVEIHAFSHIVGATVGDGCIVGPFARLRPGADLGEHVHIGNFVEIKNARLDTGAKANHLSYIGDSFVGAGANIGAGTITCNYDGFDKWRTRIGAGAFIGSNTALVAPVTVGDGAIIGAGSVITRDVAEGALAIGRGPQVEKSGRAKAWREAKVAEKAAQRQKSK